MFVCFLVTNRVNYLFIIMHLLFLLWRSSLKKCNKTFIFNNGEIELFNIDYLFVLKSRGIKSYGNLYVGLWRSIGEAREMWHKNKTIALEILYLQVKRYTWRDRIFFWQREKATPTSKCPVLSAGMLINIAYWLETHQPTVLLQSLDVPHSWA